MPTEKMLDWVAKHYGKNARERTDNWGKLLQDDSGTDLQKLTRVNDFFNQIPYLSDQANWQQVDYWASPIETLSVNAADCEDYAIAKYFTLTEIGIEPDRLRIMYVKAIELDEAHMVMTYFDKESRQQLVLDNLNKAILPTDQRPDLIPIYSFNADGLWASVDRGRGVRLGDAGRLNLWAALRRKMEEEDL